MAKTNKEATMMKGGRAGNYPSFKVTKNIRVDDQFITTGTYNYTGKERGGKGVYMNDSNYQTAGFDLDKLNMLKSRFPDSIEMIMENGGMTDEKRAEKQRLDEQMKRLREARQSRNKKIIGMQEKLHQDAMRKKMMSKGGGVDKKIVLAGLEIYNGELKRMNWERAMKKAQQLGEGWRLPTRKEALMIYEHLWTSDDYEKNVKKAVSILPFFKPGYSLWTSEKYNEYQS